MNILLPKVKYLNDQKTKEMLSDFKAVKSGWVIVENKYFLPANYVKDCSTYYNFKVKPDDTWIVTFPRSGTTLTQEMVWLLNHDMNFTAAKSIPLGQRFPFLELSMARDVDVCENVLKVNKNNAEIESLVTNIRSSSEIANSMPSPRFIKTHFPLSLVPNLLKNSKCKIVYVARNPKDVAVSYYHFQKSALCFDYNGNFEKYWSYFQNDQVCWGSYWEHLKEAWTQRYNPNLLFLFYEEMLEDLPTTIKKVARFLGKSYSDDKYNELHRHLKFSNLQNNKMVNMTRGANAAFFKTDNFIRQGKNQAWQSMFTPELNKTANNWIKKNLENTDLKFPFVDIYA